MPNTPIYTWPYPASTDYVYQGATNFQNLATAVENTVAALPVRVSDLIINGSFKIAQRSTSKSISGTTAGYNTLDRWGTNWGGNFGTWTQAQISLVNNLPAGAFGGMSMTVTTAASVQSGTALYLFQRVEQTNCQDLRHGLASATGATLSFNVLSNKTGTYIATLWDNVNSVYYSKPYTISAANTWESKTVTFEGYTSGTPFKADPSTGIELRFWIAAGANYTASTLPSSWASDGTRIATGQTSCGTTNGDTFQLANVQLVPGLSAKNWVTRPVGETLAACQRYYYRINYSGTATYDVAIGRATNNQNSEYVIPFPVQMRVAPTAIETSGTVSQYQVVTGTSSTNASGITFNGTDNLRADVQVAAGGHTAGQATGLRMNNSAAYLAWSAEL